MEEEELLTFESNQKRFFEDPFNNVEAGESSILHLLRKDIYHRMGYTIESNKL